MGEISMVKYEKYTLYAPDGDITFIMQDTYIGENLKSTEVIGFHYGEPNKDSINIYSGKRKAEYVIED
jgi:hypothetical protein